MRIPTISHSDEAKTDWAQFDRFIAELERLYPRTHERLHREVIDGHSLLFRWKGHGAGAPTVLMAHYDVVWADGEGWQHPPFAAEVINGVIWGRGILDDKASVAAVLEAVEAAVDSDFTPANDIYLSFGHNEETFGSGALAIAGVLARRGIRPALVLDEGGAVVEGVLPGVERPYAVVGVSEKGVLSLQLSVDQVGGHASSPPSETATVRLARAIVRLNNRNFPARFSAPTLEMIRTLGAHARQPYRAIYTNLALTRRALLAMFARASDETRAMVHTTKAITMLSGSSGANVLAERASAVVNLRIAIDSSVAEATEQVRLAVGDAGVVIEQLSAAEPSPVSPTTGEAWMLLRTTIEATYPSAIVTPYVMFAASDSRHFTAISDHVYRFSPFEMSADERGTLHARNERMRVASYLRGIEYFGRLIRQL